MSAGSSFALHSGVLFQLRHDVSKPVRPPPAGVHRSARLRGPGLCSVPAQRKHAGHHGAGGQTGGGPWVCRASWSVELPSACSGICAGAALACAAAWHLLSMPCADILRSGCAFLPFPAAQRHDGHGAGRPRSGAGVLAALNCMAALCTQRSAALHSKLLSCMLHGNHEAQPRLCSGSHCCAPPEHCLLLCVARRSCWAASPRAPRTIWSA